ncbi:type IV secretory system conjugative DNA transfer family protein [Methylobacterium sp. C25]|uniref:type IV secretory system conjugative DNA transfer family protein n=1 Tax=Methylobacterium sp. C25 TaxID=2721622 RepID=UPI001F3D9000|nr:type IV secretory system conjugative DNA transfer family protein [Methylobacterium sp. C25]MCE4226351.1 type IV secretory system conjugative DNA transfer family protein [Methylobacterium sp. C25]
MSLTPNVDWRLKLALGVLAAFAAVLLYLFIASNVMLLGLRRHDGGLHLLAVVEYGWFHGHEPKVARWVRLSLVWTGLPFLFGVGAVVRARPRPLHGRARFATDREVQRAGLRAGTGILLGRKGGRFLTFPGSEHVVVYAPTRSGKGVAVVIPNLLNWPGSVVVLDIKKENFLRTAGFRAAHGQEVFILDPLDADGRTARYNPLTYVRRTAIDLYDDLQRVAAMLYPATAVEDPFWAKSARAAFVGIGGYIAETEGLPFTIGEILRQLTAEADLKKHFSEIIKKRKGSDASLSASCVTALNDFLATSDNTFSSIRKSVTASLEIWLNPRIDLATAESDFDLRQLGKRPMSIYLAVTPDNLARLAPLLNLFFQQVIDLHTRELPRSAAHERDPGRQLLLLLDEFPALGNVAVLANAVPFLAGYGIRLLTILQSPSQLRAIYGPDATRTLMTNHAVEVVFRPKEQDIAEELSRRFGVDTVEGRTRSRPWGLQGGRHGRSETLSDQARPLMLPQELKLADEGTAFILMGGLAPIRAEKVVYHVDAAFTARLLAPPDVKPFVSGSAPEMIHLHRQVRQLSATVAELSATIRMRPVTDEEILDPDQIPVEALTIDFTEVAIEREHLSDADLEAFARGLIDGALARPAAA